MRVQDYGFGLGLRSRRLWCGSRFQGGGFRTRLRIEPENEIFDDVERQGSLF